MQADGVEPNVADRLACSLDVWWDVLVYQSTSLKHDAFAEVAKLVYEAAAADYGVVVDYHFAAELTGVTDDDAVAEMAVMGYMGVGHEQAVLSHAGLPLGCGALIYGDALAKHRAGANVGEGLLSLVLEILRNGGNYCAREYGDIVADARSGEYGHIAVDEHVVAYFHIFVDDGEVADAGVVAYLGIGVDAVQCRISEYVHGRLFVLDDLGHELGLADYFFAYEGVALDYRAATSDFGHETDAEQQCVAGYYFLAELYIVNF